MRREVRNLLSRRVNAAFASYRRAKANPGNVADEREAAKAVARDAAQLMQSLEALRSHPPLCIYILAGAEGEAHTDHVGILRRLSKSAQRAAAANRKTPKDLPLHSLLQSLVVWWSEANPGEHGVKKTGDQYHGGLVDYATEQFEQERLPTRGLGKRLYKIRLETRAYLGTEQTS